MTIYQPTTIMSEKTPSMDCRIGIVEGKLEIIAKLELHELSRMREILTHCKAIQQIMANVPRACTQADIADDEPIEVRRHLRGR